MHFLDDDDDDDDDSFNTLAGVDGMEYNPTMPSPIYFMCSYICLMGNFLIPSLAFQRCWLLYVCVRPLLTTFSSSPKMYRHGCRRHLQAHRMCDAGRSFCSPLHSISVNNG